MLTQEQIRQELESIAKKAGGVLKPERVVEEAMDPSHPLHNRFNWDDRSAAHSHRIDQARALIKSIRVEITTTKRVIESVYYVRDPAAAGREQGYTSIPRLLTDKEKSAAAIVQEFARALAALERARDIAAALGIDESVEDLIKRLKTISGEIPTLKNVA